MAGSMESASIVVGGDMGESLSKGPVSHVSEKGHHIIYLLLLLTWDDGRQGLILLGFAMPRPGWSLGRYDSRRPNAFLHLTGELEGG